MPGLKQQVLAGVEAAKLACQDLAMSAVLIVQGEVTHVPGFAPEPATDEYDVKIVVSKYNSKEIDGDRILASDEQALIFPEDGQPVPKLNDRIFVSTFDKEYRIQNAEYVRAGDDIALTIAQLRLQ